MARKQGEIAKSYPCARIAASYLLNCRALPQPSSELQACEHCRSTTATTRRGVARTPPSKDPGALLRYDEEEGVRGEEGSHDDSEKEGRNGGG